MSWDVSIIIDTGGEYPAAIEEVRNVTYNNSEIFDALKVHPKYFKDDSKCSTWIPSIKLALESSYKLEIEKELLNLEPENKWGGLRDSREFLTKLLECCEKHPKASVKWS